MQKINPVNMKNEFYIFTFIYFLFVCFYYIVKSRKKTHVFEAKNNWWVNGISLFAINLSISAPMLLSGIFHREGISGMWFLWSGYLISGIVPFVFAPLWAKINFITDNQFTLLRFSGRSAVYLHLFRAFYVGFFIVTFVLSFQVLAAVKFVHYFVDLRQEYVYAGLGALLVLLSVQNRLSVNIRLDVTQVLFIFLVFIMISFVIFVNYDIEISLEKINHQNPETLRFLPGSMLPLILYFAVQSWSVNTFDGSGIEAQRFFSNKNKKKVWMIAATAVLLGVLFKLLICYILIAGKANFNDPKIADEEMLIVHYLKQLVSPWFLPVIFISFLAMFVSTFSGILNWGASFLSVDFYKTYINEEADDLKMKRVSVLSMFLITAASLLCAYFSERLDVLIKLLFNISAGVAPVFVLRWFWMRINAWTQLSAMISSLIYTVVYLLVVSGSSFEANMISSTGLNDYELKLIVLTFATCTTWLTVMFLTPKDDELHLQKFKNLVFVDYNLKKALINAFSFGLLITFVFIFFMMLLIGFI